MKIDESLQHNDLKGVLMQKISFDEFEPKTGDKEDTAVIGFYVTEQSAGDDLMKFLHRSKFDLRDVEVTPNPTPDNYYMVFVEVDRKEGLLDIIKELANDITNVSGDSDWKIKPLLSDDELDLVSESLREYIIEQPGEYISKEEFDSKKEKSQFEESIKSFFSKSNALDIEMIENMLKIKDYKYATTLEFVNFGEGKLTLEESGLSELAIDSDFDYDLMNRLTSMKGSLSVVPINKHIVFHDTETDRVLVAKPC